MEAAVWICIDIFPTRSHSSPLLPLRFLRSCRAFFGLTCAFICATNVRKSLWVSSGFFSLPLIQLFTAFIIRFCARCQENAYSHINSTIYVLLINLNTYRFATLVSIVCSILSFFHSLSLRCCWILIFFFFCWCFSFHYVHARLPVALLHSNQPLLFPHIFFISLAQNKLNFAKREKEWEKKRSTRFASKSTLNGWIYLSATHMLCGDMQNVHREYIIRSVRA